jgi:hypothetical protein
VAGANVADPDAYRLDFTSSVFIAGFLHILHNTTKDLQDVLGYWDTFINFLRQVCRLLSRKWSRDRLLETCFCDYPERNSRCEIERFKAHVYEGRWGSIWHAIGQISMVKDVLKYAWSKAAFLRGKAEMRPRGDAETDEHSIKIDIADNAIRSNLFWGYCVMLDRLGETFEKLAFWSESCPCHFALADFEGLTRWHRGRVMMQHVGQSTCPMQTLQAPACAAGEHFMLIRDLMATSNRGLIMHPAISCLTQEERATVMRDWTAGAGCLSISAT